MSSALLLLFNRSPKPVPLRALPRNGSCCTAFRVDSMPVSRLLSWPTTPAISVYTDSMVRSSRRSRKGRAQRGPESRRGFFSLGLLTPALLRLFVKNMGASFPHCKAAKDHEGKYAETPISGL